MTACDGNIGSKKIEDSNPGVNQPTETVLSDLQIISIVHIST